MTGKRARPKSASAAKARIQAVQNRYKRWGKPAPDLPTLGFESNRCWCGEPKGHTWPGAAEGEPHPRSPRHEVPR